MKKKVQVFVEDMTCSNLDRCDWIERYGMTWRLDYVGMLKRNVELEESGHGSAIDKLENRWYVEQETFQVIIKKGHLIQQHFL